MVPERFRSLCLQEYRVTVSSRTIADDSPIRDAIATDAAICSAKAVRSNATKVGGYWL